MRFVVTLLICLFFASAGAKAPRTSKSVRRQQQQTETRIKRTNEALARNSRKIANALNELNSLNSDIESCNKDIAALQDTVNAINSRIAVTTDSITWLDGRIEELRQTMITVLRQTRRTRSAIDNLSFIFSSGSFSQAYRRLQAMKEFSVWRNRKASELSDLKSELSRRKAELTALREKSAGTLARLDAKRSTLQTRRNDTDRIVASLKGKKRDLDKVLKQQQQRARQLDNELQRLIAEEAEAARRAEEERRRQEELARQQEIERQEAEAKRKAEEERQLAEAKNKSDKKKKSDKKSKDDKKSGKKTDKGPKTKAHKPDQQSAQRSSAANGSKSSTAVAAASTPKLSANFADNKGKLPFPVEGKYSIVRHFGRNKHPNLPNIETENAGIDIQTASGATVRSVFDGEVSAIICSDGYNNVVLLRHGTYVTVYANIGTLSVRKGDKVKRNQPLGTVYVDTSDSNRSILHFEIRNASTPGNITKENPEIWLRR